jgi:hypothetical protein
MFSGGLDSVIACHLLKSLGCEVTALHFVLPFQAGLGLEHRVVRDYAEALDVPLMLVEEGNEFLDMARDPHFGYGKHANPCVDCRIHRLKKAGVIMKETGSLFLATGEVAGQRPMSQRMETMIFIEKQSGLSGYLLRPLSALLLEPTIPETNGLVDRSRLLGISGRGRKEQLEYARRFGLKHSTPAGGCILTQAEIGDRFMELRRTNSDFELDDFKMLAYGRHFRINPYLKLIVGRDDRDNTMLMKIAGEDDVKFLMAGMEGPLAVAKGAGSESDESVCASITARYSKAKNEGAAAVKILRGTAEKILEVKPASDEFCASLRI